jgi:uncharacterized protein YndB with AHSA1/START domain
MTELTLNVSRTINATPEKLFNAWLDPKMLARFMLPGDGMSVPSATCDPVEGGRFDIIMRAGDQDIPHAGTYKKIDRHTQLVFTWESPFSVDGSTVTLKFTPVDAGTRVDLNHVKFPSQESRDNHDGGWVAILAALETIAV